MAWSSKKRRAPKLRLAPSQIDARHVRMARAALGMTTAQFGRLVGLSANTISHIEHAHVTLSRTIDGVKQALRGVGAIEWLPDNGESIGIRLHYSRLNEPLEPAPLVYGFKRGRGVRRYDPDEIKRDRIGSDYPLEQLMKEYSDDRERYRRDQRIGKRSKVAAGDTMPDAANTVSAAPAKGVPISMTLAKQRIANGGNPIRVWRQYHNMSLTTLAKKIRIAKGFLSQIETGKRSASAKLQYKVARALGIKIQEIAPVTLTDNKPEPVPAASVPTKPMKDGTAAPTDLTNEPGVPAPPAGMEPTTVPNPPPPNSPSSSTSLNIQRYEHMARQEGIPLERWLDGMGKYHEDKFAEMRERKPRRR